MDGGPGDDWLRGDTNGDDFIGGPGDDVASFMTARPTGKSGKNAKTVVDIDLPKGRANGDGADEVLKGIEKVIGSPFDDSLVGAADKLAPSHGNDLCNGSPCGYGASPALPFVFVDARPRDTGVIVLGGTDDDHLVFSRENGDVVVTETSGGVLHAGAHCTQIAPTVVKCQPKAPLKYLMAFGDDGNDELTIEDGFPRDFNAHLDGGDGDDDLFGADGEDVLFSGRSGVDRLDGGPGDDALISESYADDRGKSGKDYPGGADTLLGRGGNDQLVTDYPCGRHFYSGGPGVDIAGFARVGDRAIHAQLGGPVSKKANFHGKAFLPGVCDVDLYGTHLEDDLEILEGSKGNDHLFGNDRDNIIWGRQGKDLLAGFGGTDVLLGHEGADQVHGGDGDDVEKQ
jgi:Ca2+-binding RTX toxin-like protein